MILNRALLREVLYTSGAVTVVMICIFLVVRVVGFLRQAAEGQIPVDSVVVLLLLKMMTYLDVIIPLMLYVSIIMVLGRWSRDNELTVIAACGIGLGRFLVPMLYLFLAVGSLVAAFSLYLSPLAVRMAQSIEDEFEQRSEISGIVPGVFHETQRGTGVYFVERFNPRSGLYENVFAYGQEQDKEAVVVAAVGFQSVDTRTGDQFLVLKNGTRYEGTPGEPDYAVVDFETYALRLRDKAPVASTVPVKGMETTRLLVSSDPILVSELHWRLAKVVSIPVLMLFALSLSAVDGRRSRLPGMLTAFLVYFAYTNLLGFMVAVIRRGGIDPVLGLWSVHAAFLVLGVYLFARRSRNRPLLPTFRALSPAAG